MSLGAPQTNFVTDLGQVCQKLLDLQGSILELNELYNGTPDWATLITDQELATIADFAAAGITAQNVADAVYQVNLVRTQVLTGNLPALVVLAQVG